MSRLEYLVRPGHCDGHGGAEAKADEEKTDIAGPGMDSVGRDEKTCNLDESGDGEEEGAVVVETVGYWGDE